ncbi:unnamed protein product [Effrenium voratum]|uniref:Protein DETOXIFICATION n=1 Tax=Effrenium voratum TaxID=2562239 RepID=A0AA36HR05_9DINO|nr:unnamed protein product [Effrenium voratum]CAJ1373733.1 unnamed protein product [Effrenium voratum]CAJ1412236.1 unnamed protein product [Effrenium voratum]
MADMAVAGMAVAGREALAGETRPTRTQTALELMKFALPTMLGNFLTLINEFTNTIALGHAGEDSELAAVGLGNMMQNCFGLSVAIGLTNALDTLVSQAHGAGENELCVHYLQRGRAIITAQLLWMIPLLCSTEVLLLAVGQHPDVAKHAASYNRIASFGLFFVMQWQATWSFLRNKGLPNVGAWVAGVTSIFHILWAYIFIHVFKMGNAGAGAANCTTWALQFLAGSVILTCKAPGLGSSALHLLGVGKESFKQWKAYLAIGVPAMLQLCAEWWFWEICALVIGYLGPTPLAAHVAASNLVVLLFMPSISLSYATSSVVGNSIGAMLPMKARQAAWLAAGLDVLLWTIVVLILISARKVVAAILTSDEVVQDIAVQLLDIYCVAGYFDNIQTVFGGSLRGLGLNRAPAVAYLFCFYLISLPLGCCFVWPLQMGVYGLWWSMVVGTALTTLILGILLYRVDWTKMALLSEERIRSNRKEQVTSSTVSPSA